MEDARQTHTRRDEDYRRTRDTFNEMKLEDQATFLVEATASLLARGIEETGRAVADGIDELFRPKARRTSRDAPGARGPGPAEPETSQQRRPRGGAQDASDH